jgi:dihydrofolate reductase
MLHNQKIIFVTISDNQSKMIADLGTRVWHHEILVRGFLQKENCLMGRKTYEMTKWKGEKSWVLTSDKNWRKPGIGTIHDLDDLHLHCEGPIYVLGGQSVFQQLEKYVDEIHMYVINNREGTEDWIRINMKDWKPRDYRNENVWSYAHLIGKPKGDPIDYMTEELFE